MTKHKRIRHKKKAVVTACVLCSVLSTLLLPLQFVIGVEIAAALIWIWIDEV